MPEPDLLQRQREILRTFRQATAQRAKAEADAEARRKADREAANVTLDQAHLMVAAQLTEANKTLETVQAALTRVGLQHLLKQAKPAPSTARPDAEPSHELARCVSVATETHISTQASIEEWREKRLQLIQEIACLHHRQGLLGWLWLSGAKILAVTFSLDGKTLASSSSDGTVKLWEVVTGRELRTIVVQEFGAHSTAFSCDGRTLALGGHKTVKLWDIATGRGLRTLQGHTSFVRSVAFSPESQILASGSFETVKLWDIATGHEVCTLTLGGHANWAMSVAFSPNGKTLASGSSDGTVRVWQVSSGRELYAFSGDACTVYSLAFLPDCKTLASGSSAGTVKLWDVATGRELRSLSGHAGAVYSVTFSPDGKTLASGSNDKTVKLWDIATGRELRTLRGHTSSVSSVIFSPDGQILASGSSDRTVRLWGVK